MCSADQVDSGSDVRALEIAQDCGKSDSFLYLNDSCTKEQPDTPYLLFVWNKGGEPPVWVRMSTGQTDVDLSRPMLLVPIHRPEGFSFTSPYSFYGPQLDQILRPKTRTR